PSPAPLPTVRLRIKTKVLKIEKASHARADRLFPGEKRRDIYLIAHLVPPSLMKFYPSHINRLNTAPAPMPLTVAHKIYKNLYFLQQKITKIKYLSIISNN
ncbi:MAG: hypothetical protein Q8R42_01005, partial [Desulfocapsaceae bacterium]|nr:hypothetical protein [Desulfocapsaceae bacterium]